MVCFANDDIKPHQQLELVTLHIHDIQHASKFIDDFDELLLGLLFSLFQPFQFGCESFFDLVLEPYQLALDVILYKDKDRNSNTRRNVMGSNVRYGEILNGNILLGSRANFFVSLASRTSNTSTSVVHRRFH